MKVSRLAGRQISLKPLLRRQRNSQAEFELIYELRYFVFQASPISKCGSNNIPPDRLVNRLLVILGRKSYCCLPYT